MKLYFNNNKENNILSSILDNLGIKYTDEYANRLYNEHPHKYNLFGLSKMLSDYNIENTGIRIQNKQEGIRELDVPFIAYVSSDFVVVYRVTFDRVYYIWNKKYLNITIDEFCRIWSGIILYAEPNENSVEPNYKSNYKRQVFKQLQKTTLGIGVFIILILAFVENNLYKSTAYYLLALVNLIGIYVSYLLILKQIHIHSEYADKICSLFSRGDCNNVLESDAAKLGGLIGWSEIGLGYFITNVLVITCFPDLILYMALINVLVLPYSFWSIWYQKVKAKQWCILCLIVQCVLWSLFFLSLKYRLIYVSEINFRYMLLMILLYIIPILFINILVSNFGQNKKMEQITQELNSIKADENVFLTMLKKQPYYEVKKSTSSILWGNTESDNLVTILTNPHCNPCAKMHNRLKKIMDESNNFCVQYIFSSFGSELDISNKFLTAIYFDKGTEDRNRIFQEWFEKGKNIKDEFFKIYSLNVDEEKIANELEKHLKWKQKTSLSATPTILVNGYKLPDNYKIEDLKYFEKIDLTSIAKL